MSAAPILEVEGLAKRFGGFTALADVTARFFSGSLTSIIGPNGAGKSTFFNLISGSLAPSAGRIRFQGRDITAEPQHRFAHLGIAKSFQITNLFPQLSVLENVRVAAQAMTVPLRHLDAAARTTATSSRAPRSFSRPSASPPGATTRSRTWPMATSAASRSPSRSPATRGFCSSTSRPPA